MSPRIPSVAQLDFRLRAAYHPSPLDWRDQFIYFLLVDRFDDQGDHPPYDPATAPRGRDPAEGRRFQGGKLKGITRRLDYIKGLGCTTVWISPVLKNRLDLDESYHGYGVQDFLEVDPRFGTLADLQELVAEAHRRGMYVIQDIIVNHAGDVFAYEGGVRYYERGATQPFAGWREADPAPGLQEHDAVWPVELQRPEAFKRLGQIRHWWEPAEARDGDFLSLKELNLPRPEVLDTLIKIYKYWIAATDVDGFRVDTVKHVEDSAAAIFCNAIREYAQRIGKHRFFLFGEIVADDGTIERYLGRNSRIEGTNERFPSLDAALDFPLYFELEEAIKGFSNPARLRARYDAFHSLYADHGEAGRYFVTFVDNHDQMSRPYRRFLHDNPYRQQALLAVAYLLTSQGVPCLYYGTEQGFDGGGPDDSHVRECMFGGRWGAFDSTGRHFFDPGHPIYQGIAAIAKVRAAEPALRYGRQYFREISGNGRDFGHPIDGRSTLAYSRILDTQELLVVLNLDHQPRYDAITVDARLSPPGSRMVNLLAPHQEVEVKESGGRAYLRVDLPGHGLAILRGP